MRLLNSFLATALSALLLSPLASAERVIESSSLNSCQDGSNFTATLFDVVFTPSNNSIAIDIIGVSSIQGNVTAQLQVIAYGFTVLNETLDPCQLGLHGMCPMATGQINLNAVIPVGSDIQNKVPGITYGVPDLDGVVKIIVNDVDTGRAVACVQAQLSNTKTVYQKAVGWATAIIAGLGLVASGITSGLGHTNTAAHVAANALSLFGFFQAQALIGMSSVTMPPIVQAWTQNFQWSMGIVKLGFLQSICTWYQRATGGTPTTYLSTLATSSVQVQKRSLDLVSRVVPRAVEHMIRRATTDATTQQVVVRGIDRVGFRAGIEQTNIFLTGLIFFVVILFLVAIFVAMFKGLCEVAVKANWMKADKFVDFRNGWKIVLKGILFRLVLLGYVQMSVLCLWELVERDSAAEVVLAIVVFLSMSAALGWAALKVIRLAKRSVMMHKNPAYILYSDPQCLNKWGFLYVQYRASAYYFVLPMLGYILCKAIFIAFAQSSPIAQAVGLVIVEAVALIVISVVRPFMDRKTNIFNISIAVINFLNAIFLLVFSNAFGQPEMVSGIMGVLFALYNVIFAVVLLVLVLIASIYAIAAKNPETRYQPMRDDRGSFIKSQAALTTELDALGATARGDQKMPYGKTIDDDESFSTDSLNRDSNLGAQPAPPGTAGSHVPSAYNAPTRNATSPDRGAGAAMYPGENAGRRGPPQMSEQQRPYDGYGQQNRSEPDFYAQTAARRAASPYSDPRGGYPQQQRAPSSHSNREGANGYRQPGQFRSNENTRPQSPWQIGAGYEH